MSAADIGKVVGMSRFAVHRRLKEGLALLKKELA
jgi:DNA-directed RNA polymerase specialized sigma24 family protein